MKVTCSAAYCDGKYYAEVYGPDGEELFTGSVGHRDETVALREARKIAKKNGHEIVTDRTAST